MPGWMKKTKRHRSTMIIPKPKPTTNPPEAWCTGGYIHCQYCGSIFKSDSRGNCVACGAPAPKYLVLNGN